MEARVGVAGPHRAKGDFLAKSGRSKTTIGQAVRSLALGAQQEGKPKRQGHSTVFFYNTFTRS